MAFNHISDQELLARLEKLTRTERKITHAVLLHISEVESRGLYAGHGFSSLFNYLTRALCYSESAAYRRIQAARLLKSVPAVAEKLESGALNLSQLTEVQKCLKEEKKKGVKVTSGKVQEVFVTLENKSTFESQRILALEFNQPVKLHQSVKSQQDDSVRIEVTFSKEQFEILKQSQSLLSHVCPEGDWNTVLTTLAQKFNQTKLGKNSQSISLKKSATQNESSSAQSNTEAAANATTASPQRKVMGSQYKVKRPQRTYISVKIKRRLLSKAHYRCEFVDPKTGHRCTSKYQLQTDHSWPLALGGEHAEFNFRTLCRRHNIYEAQRHGLWRPTEDLARNTLL